MNKAELLIRLSDIEWDDFEVKEARSELPKNIWETVSSFSNGSGGWIVFGVSQNGKKFEVTGVENAEKLEQDFTTVLRSKSKFNVLINPVCKKYTIENKAVLSFFIPSSDQKPVYFNMLANSFIRSGSGDQRATDSEINAMFRDQLFGVMSARSAKNTSLDDLNRLTLTRYRDYMARFNPSSPYNALSEMEFLERLQIIEGDHLTYGGLLFMGKNTAINRNVSDFRIDLLEIPGRSYADAEPRYTYRLEERENLWEYYFSILDRLKQKIDIPFKMNGLGFAFEDSPQLNALREALVNMLMHADYFSTAKPRVRIFRDRIEFENPGNFPLPIDVLLKVDISLPRNPVIAKLFRNVKLAENAGYGFMKMLGWEKETLTKVVFSNSIAFSVVTFRFPAELQNKLENNSIGNLPEESDDEKNKKSVTNNDEQIIQPSDQTDQTGGQTDQSGGQTGGQTDQTGGQTDQSGGQTGGQTNERLLTQVQRMIIDFIIENPGISRKEMSDKLNMNVSAVQKHIEKLKKTAVICRIGGDFGGHWKVL